MKKIELYTLDADPTAVHQPLGYDVCLEGFEPGATSSAHIEEMKWFPTKASREPPFPLPIQMHGAFEWAGIGQKDILAAEPGLWRVVSKRLLTYLNTLGTFAHQALPVSIWDSLVRPEDDPRQPSPRRNDDYVLLHLFDALDLFDYRASEHNFFIVEDGRVTAFRERAGASEAELQTLEERQLPVTASSVVLSTREDALPPVFRLSALPTRLFVTAWAAQRIARSGLTNVWLQPNLEPVFCQDDALASANV